MPGFVAAGVGRPCTTVTPGGRKDRQFGEVVSVGAGEPSSTVVSERGAPAGSSPCASVDVGAVVSVVGAVVSLVDDSSEVAEVVAVVDSVVLSSVVSTSVWCSSGWGRPTPTASPAVDTADWTGSGRAPATARPLNMANVATPAATSLALRVCRIIGRFLREASGTVAAIPPSPATNR